MRRSCLWIVPLALLAFPLSAQTKQEPLCGIASPGSSVQEAKGTAASQPRAAEKPLFFEIPAAKVGTPKPIFATYLPNCNDCTWDLPCDTECGYDPGKGGPVTCGEYGGICTPR